jgi:hypothetical protein
MSWGGRIQRQAHFWQQRHVGPFLDKLQFSGETTMRLAKYVKFREEKFGGVLFETRSEKVFTLNSTATAVIREIEAGRDEREILTRLQDHFRDSAGAIEREAVAFIADLRDKGLLEE